MQADATVTFDADPRYSAHVEIAFGKNPSWLHATIFCGPEGEKGWVGQIATVAQIVVMHLGASALTRTDLRRRSSCAFVTDGCSKAWADVVQSATNTSYAKKVASQVQDATKKKKTTKSSTSSSTMFPRSQEFLQRANTDPWADATWKRPIRGKNKKLIESVYSKIIVYSKRYGSVPDFASTKASAVLKANNYIISVSGQQLDAETVEAVKSRLVRKSG